MSNTIKNVEDIYTLSPMQEAMLLHASTHPHDDVLVNQFVFDLRGELDFTALRQAWNAIVARHPSLRTAFVWGKKSAPVQIVRGSVELPFLELDWRDDSTSNHSVRLDEFCARDRKQAIELTSAPLMRIAIVRLDDDYAQMIWTSHHLVLDRWCLGTVLSELVDNYGAACNGQRVQSRPAAPFKKYIEWLRNQSSDAATGYWQKSLSGLRSPATVSRAAPAVPDDTGNVARVSIDSASMGDVRNCAKKVGVTVSTVVQAALALALNRICKVDDIVFGVTVSGRTPEVAEIESIVGTFISNLPVRLRFEASTNVHDWLRDLQQAQHLRSPFEYLSLANVHECSDVAPASPLFDVLLVWLAPVVIPKLGGVEMRPVGGGIDTSFPITIGVHEDGDRLELTAELKRGYRIDGSLTQVLDKLGGALHDIASSNAATALTELAETVGTAIDRPGEDVPARIHARRRQSGHAASPVAPSGRENVDVAMMRDMLATEVGALLGGKDIGVDENLFEAGLTSLMAARLHGSIESVLRQSVPMLALFRESSIAAMAELLVQEDWPLTTGAVAPLNESGHLAPLFMVASPEVNTVGYALLARHLGVDRVAYVVQAPPDSSRLRRISPAEIPELASYYIEELRQWQPRGPYYLLGMCSGSQIALEMAGQLKDAGEKVNFVGVINTWATYTVTRRYLLTRLANRVRYYGGRIRGLVRLGPRGAFAELSRVIDGRRQGTPQQPDQTNATTDQPTLAPDSEEVGAGDDWIEEYGWAWKNPKQAKYPGSVCVVRTRSHPQAFWRTRDADLGWGRHAESTDVIVLPDHDHEALLREPFVRLIADELRLRLDVAESASVTMHNEKNDNYVQTAAMRSNPT